MDFWLQEIKVLIDHENHYEARSSKNQINNSEKVSSLYLAIKFPKARINANKKGSMIGKLTNQGTKSSTSSMSST